MEPPIRKKQKPVYLAIGCAAVVLVIVILALAFRPGSPEETITKVPGHNAYSLEQVGQIQDADRSVRIDYDVISKKAGTASGFHLLNYLGEDLTNWFFEKAEYLGYGLFAVTRLSDNVNSVGVVNTAGKVLIPTEACHVEWPYLKDEGNCRYLVVYYATEEVSADDDYFVCVDEYGGVYTSDVGGTRYGGFTKIFDLEKKQFIGDLCLPYHSSDVQICGNNIVVGNNSNGYTLYDTSGNVLLQTTDSIYVGDGTLVINSGGTYRVYDETGTQTYSANKAISLIGHSQYIKMKSGEQYVAMDRSGNPVLQDTYDNITDENNGIFVVENDGKMGLVTIAGTEIAPCLYDDIDKIYRADEIGGGFYYAKTGLNIRSFALMAL